MPSCWFRWRQRSLARLTRPVQNVYLPCHLAVQDNVGFMSQSYGQYCPLALAVELLGRRWMILVVSRLIDGCTTFNDIRRGLPQISPTLLSKRLKELVDAGVATHTPSESGRSGEYLLTEAGRELEPIVDKMAIWGQHWARDMDYEDLDPAFLVWSMHLRADTSVLPPGQTVVEFGFDKSPTNCKRFWLVCRDDEVEMCLKDPGLDVDVAVQADLQVFVEAWRGFRDLRNEIQRGSIKVHGPRELTRAIPSFLLGSSLAPFERRRRGRERKIARAAGSI